MSTESDWIQERLVAALGDRYEVDGLLDEGGMALIFRARDLKHDRAVAVKVLKPDLAVTVGAQRFLQEIQIAATLSHPNILPLHDSGEADGLPYYVMPFVKGESLRKYISRKGTLSPGETLRIIGDVARGLTLAHDQGVIHRDVKPENVLMSAGVAVVMDFGIARALQRAGSEGLTQTGSTPSTPLYASPEQLWDQGDVDHRADQYALASMAFEILTGRTPFQGNPASVATRKVSEDPPDLARFRPELPSGVGPVLGRALSRDPSERFPDLASFVEALESSLNDPQASVEGPIERRRGGGRRVRERVGRGPVLAGGLLLVLLLTLVLIPRASPPALPPGEEHAVLAVLPFLHIGTPETTYLTDGMTDEVATHIGQIPEVAVVSLASSRLYDARVQAVDEIGRELGATHVLTGSIRIDQGEAEGRIRFTPRLIRTSDALELWSSTLDADLRLGQIFQVQASVAEEVARALDLVLSPTLAGDFSRPTENLEAYGYYLRASPLGSQFLVAEDARSTIEMYQRAVALDPEFARAHAGLGRAQSLYYYFFDRTPERYEAASAAVRSATALAPNDRATRIAEGYLAYWGRLDYEAAIEAFMDAGAATSSDSELLWVLASVLRRQGDYQEALRTFQRGLRLDPRSALNHFEVGGTLIMMRRFDEAMPFARQARVLAPDWTPAALAEGVLLVLSGREEEAGRYLDALATDREAREAILPQLVEEVIYRPLWELALGEEFQVALEEASSEDFVDPAAYYMARVGRARRTGDQAALRLFADSVVQALGGRTGIRPGGDWARIDLASALAQAGREEEARGHLRGMHTSGLVSQDAFRGPIWALELARAQVWLGDETAALESLEALRTTPVFTSDAFLLADPALSRLAGDPRFAEVATSLSTPVH